MRFFHSVTSLEELKKQFRKLALKHHPDKEGGSEKIAADLAKQFNATLIKNF